MKQLAKLQHTFQDCVLQPSNPVSTAWVSASGRATPEKQLSVYTHAYRSRLKEVLMNDYPAMLLAIGEDMFGRLADDYIQAHPSHYFSLRDFGLHLPSFVFELIRQHDGQDINWPAMPWLHELAIFEWTLGQAFDVADVTLFTEQDMATLPPEVWSELTFSIHPSVQRLDLEWNIPEMWQALTTDNPTPVSAVRDVASPWLIWREDLITRYRSMQTDEQRALDTLLEGGSFNEACEALATLMSEYDVPLRAASLLKAWIAQGLISGIN